MNFSDFTHQQADDPVRRAAVVAHALSTEDQAWLFSQMAPAELDHLKSLIAELVQLGVPSDRRLLEQALAGTEPETVSLPSKPGIPLAGSEIDDLDFFDNLTSENLDVLISILVHEPALLIARFLRIRNWPWQQTVLDGLPAPLRRQVADLLADPLGVAISGLALEAALLRTLRLRGEPWAASVRGRDKHASSRWRPALINAWLQRLALRRQGGQS